MFAPSFICAQKEASVWPVGSGKQINFQSGNFEFSEFPGNPNAKSTICDKNGNLVLYTDGRTIWNKNHEIVANGEKLIPDDAFHDNRPIFVPYPKKEGWYILVYGEEYYTITSGKYDNALYYAEINADANNGKGVVVRQKIKIHDNYHSGPTIAGYCDNSYYWLVIDRNDNTVIDKKIDRIYCYKIDENGVNATPVINDYFNIGSSGGYRFSPNGDKFYFFYGGNFVDQKVITDFNFQTGELYNYRVIDFNFIWRKEFSPDSRFLYFFEKGNLIQIDVGYSNSVLVMNSADTILTLGANEDYPNPGQDLRLGPDGKIYFYYYDINDRKLKLGKINQPNHKGSACDVELSFLTLDSYDFRFPEFVTSFFRDKHPEMLEEVFPEAGPDIELCANSSVTIGIEEHAEAFYQWTPNYELEDPFSAQPVFKPSKTLNTTPQTQIYTLRATDGNCWLNFDKTTITVLPVPKKLPIDGSWSVCPFVEEVDYWTVDDKNKLNWLVDGGEIVTDSSKDSIKISWGETNMHASASVISTNGFGCSDTTVFPVRINVELITESPKGSDRVCIAESKNVNYQIKNTNGSVYNWTAEGGEIATGQGTNKVVINWFGEGTHKLTVEETSTTIDTICFGESNPVMVEVVNDSLEIELLNVSYNPEQIIILNYNSEKLSRTNHIAFLEIQDESGNTLKEMNVTGIDDGSFYYLPPVPFSYPAIINLKILNTCNEIFYSNPQQVIILDGIEDVVESAISLNWNINKYWESDDLEHEIWFSENGKSNWKMVAKTEKNDFDFPLNGLTLTHFFRVYEHNKSRNTGSWSNTIKVEVEGKLLIPDVFTPNGDGINDEWEIRNVQFHSFQQAVIFNRFGQVVYECKNEFIPWDGRINGEIIQGTYLYQITFDSKNVKYGQVTVLK
jgi:gliding motility-associated-like protein